ncbi:hypothetical protein GCM10023311_27680 [Flaviramulus aquimarinus]|uniref:WD40-like Beta Propeller Repeat n=1 Tax=Flaviramulus aquimarinus TaxID=1170456 RepID=A0ABP9FEG7_9FLAO
MLKKFCYIIFLSGLLSFSQAEDYNVKNLKVNTENTHFGLMPFGNDKIIFTSYFIDSRGKVKRYEGNPVLTVFEGDLSDDGNIINISPIQIAGKKEIAGITSATISPDGKFIYITTQYTRKNRPKGDFKDTNFHIKVGEFKASLGWTNFKVLPFCKPRYSYAHPTLSHDGKTLYFTANIRGGKETTKGGSDIFKVDVLGENKYGEPKNLGSKVNSYSREMFPFMSADNILYFASNRPSGFGGFDIYKSHMNVSGVFEKAEKLPKPFNSKQDDFSLIMNPDNTSGYFVSKRIGGKGDDDIYYFLKI